MKVFILLAVFVLLQLSTAIPSSSKRLHRRAGGRFLLVDRYSGKTLATKADIDGHIDDILDEMDSVCGEWCIARLADGRVHGRGYPESKRIDDIDPYHEETLEIVLDNTVPDCPLGEFSCTLYGICMPNSWKCDGMDDCGDNSDEEGCSTTPLPACGDAEFSCDAGQCVPALWQCDGMDDCGDNSDEQHCQPEGEDAGVCYNCIKGPLAGIFNMIFGENIPQSDNCLEPDQSTPTMKCFVDGDVGNCATIHIRGQGVADNILRTCLSRYVVTDKLPISSFSYAATLENPLSSNPQLKMTIGELPFANVKEYLFGLTPGRITASASVCDPADEPVPCAIVEYPAIELPSILSGTVGCETCFTGDLAQYFFSLVAKHEEFADLRSLISMKLPEGKNGQCTATAPKECNKETCLGAVLDIPGKERNIAKVCLPESSVAAMMIGMYSPVSDYSLQVTLDTSVNMCDERLFCKNAGEDCMPQCMGITNQLGVNPIPAGVSSMKIVLLEGRVL